MTTRWNLYLYEDGAQVGPVLRGLTIPEMDVILVEWYRTGPRHYADWEAVG